jgi:hypothetical protein
MAATLEYKLTGGASNSDPDASLGGVGSSVSMSGTAANNLFDNVYPTETVVGVFTEYRAIDIYNSGDAEAGSIEFYIEDTANLESSIAIWYDPVGTQEVAQEGIEPSGATWSQPLVGSKLSLANLAAGASHRIWVRRTINQLATNIVDDTATLHVWYA